MKRKTFLNLWDSPLQFIGEVVAVVVLFGLIVACALILPMLVGSIQ